MIADVTTPILGVETLLRENLSLSDSRATSDSLFMQSGEFTQLTQEGKLLYLRAFPAQVGPTHLHDRQLASMIASLSENKLEQVALGLGATLSTEEVLEQRGSF